jgi:ribonuclease Z
MSTVRRPRFHWRHAESKQRSEGEPSKMANVVTFDAKSEPAMVWSWGDVKVSATRSTHIGGHASYRVDTPAGSVVIGGDAGNDKVAPRGPQTSECH